ncbi:hypothetical protein evm_008300 [Chilo suppressalis]|nr:hypothetical protein evm_008300 [Chilo suppressalis]
MKRKVQAQRKFAQGAYIPPSANSNPPPERRGGHLADPQPLEQKNVFYNKMSADMLLDIISFQNLHQRPEPVVVLKRLSKGHEKPEPLPVTIDNDSGREATRRPAQPRKNTMLLRSRNRHTFKTRKIAQKAKKRVRRRILKKVVPPPPKALLRKRKLPTLTDGYDLEDDKPLKFFASSSGSLRSDATKRRRLKIVSEAKVLKHKSSKVIVKELRSVSALKKNPIRVAVKRTVRIPSVSKPNLRSRDVKRSPEKSKHKGKRQRVETKDTRPSRSVTPPLQKSPIAEPKTKRLSVPATTLQSPSTSNAINEDLPSLSTAVNGTYPSEGISVEGWLDSAQPSTPERKSRSFKMPLRPNRRRDDAKVVKKIAKLNPAKVKKLNVKVSRKSSADTLVLPVDNAEKIIKKSVKEPAPSPETCEPLKKEHILENSTTRRHSEPKSDEKPSQNAAIEGWLQNSLGNSNEFKSPILPAKRAVPGPKPPEDSLDPSLRSRSVDSICSSERFRSVKDIVNAGEHELESRCKQRNCQACCRVNKLRQLKNIVQKSTNKRADVYEFNDDTAVCSMGIYRGLRVPQRDTPSSSTSSLSSLANAPEDQPVYLDVFPNGTHIIQITDLNKKNRIMRASVVPKSEADIRNEFSLIEHENLLDQLLEIKLFNLQKIVHSADKSSNERSKVLDNNKPSDVIVIPDESGTESDDADVTLGSIRTRRRAESTNVPKESQTNPTSQQSDRVNALPKKNAKAVTKKATESTSAPKNTSQNDTPPDNVGFPRELDSARLVDAPVFYPTEAEFNDPIAYFEKISATAAKFGLCKVVAPNSFRPSCSVSDEIRFNVSNQYVARLYRRWGAAARETCAIRAYLAAHSVTLTRAPLYEGIEVNLPKLYHIVQRNGGLKNVIEKKRWGRVAEEMHYTRAPNAEKRLDQLYVKYLLPYDTLSTQERQEMMDAVERCWDKKNRKMLERALNPLHRQKRLLGESDSSDDAEEEDDMAWALAEAEDCVVSGRSMTLATFKKVANSAMETLFPNSEQPSPSEVEREYWRLVLLGTEHVCVNAASIDTGEDGHGFTKNKADPYGRHPWNLKRQLPQSRRDIMPHFLPKQIHLAAFRHHHDTAQFIARAQCLSKPRRTESGGIHFRISEGVLLFDMHGLYAI